MTQAVPWLIATALLAAIVALFAGLRWFQLRRSPDPEIVRKAFHMGGGILALSLPWLFDDLAPVLALGALIGALFLALRLWPPLRDGAGQVLLGVRRQSVGEFGFLASIGLLFWLARGDKLLYSIPLMMVALADAFAALVGRAYGKFELHVHGDRKTIEGITTFFLTAFLCIHVPVLLSGETARLESLLIAVNVAAMVMLAEAAAWWGLDNIIIPVWGYLVLKSAMPAGSAELIVNFVFLVGLTSFVYWWRAHTSLGDDALAGTVLWGYVVWSVGGLAWLMPPLLQLVTYATLTAPSPHDATRVFRFPVALANLAGGIPWLLWFRESGDAALLIPFAACFGANVTIIALVRLKSATPSMAGRWAVAAATAVGMMVIVPSMVAAYQLKPTTAVGIGAALLAVVVSALVFYRLQPRITEMPVDYDRFLRQALVTTAGSVVAFLVARAEFAALARWEIR